MEFGTNVVDVPPGTPVERAHAGSKTARGEGRVRSGPGPC